MPASVELSRREREVAGLVAEGLSNRQIAERLFISERTAEGHVEQILNKLGFDKRTQIAAWVARGQGDNGHLVPGRAPSAVPRPLSSLVGRSAEIQSVVAALDQARLVTLTGPGGVGKTRVALEAAASADRRFRDGSWFVELDSVSDAASVAIAVAHALRVPQSGAGAVDDELAAHLAKRDALVILDNCEHVVEACRELVVRILSRGGRVRVMATSREPLGVAGERIIALAPLPVRTDAVELFAARCRDLGAGALTKEEEVLASTICERLDGIPLAIELAAAQTPVLSLASIAGRLGDRFGLLKRGSAAASPRHQALEQVVDWSYRLLPPEQAAAFCRLSVFRGGFELDAAEAVLDGSGLEMVAALIRKSMLVPRDQPSGERRYHMLETLRDFAARRLESSGELRLVRERHAAYFLALSRQAFARLRSGDSDLWVRRLDIERGNITAALDHLYAAEDERFLPMVAALGRYWIRGRLRDGYRWTERAMHLPDPRTATNVELLEAWSWLTWQSAMTGPAFEAMDRMLASALEAHDDAAAGRALNMMATFRNDSRLPVDPELWRRAERHLRRAGEDWPLALLLNDIGFVTTIQGKPATGLPKILEGLELARRAGDRWLTALILDSAAWAYVDLGNLDSAVKAWAEGISFTVAAADRYGLPNYLEGFARIARIEGDPVRACVLLGAAAAVRDGIGARPLESWSEYMSRELELVRAALGDVQFEAAWNRGLDLSAEAAAELALSRA